MCKKGNFLEGIALGWYNSWLNAPGEHTWQEFFNAMFCRFGRSHSALSIAWMWDNLKQEDSVEEYTKAYKKTRKLADSQVQANQGFLCHMFLQNLKPRLARFICDKDCKTIEDAYRKFL